MVEPLAFVKARLCHFDSYFFHCFDSNLCVELYSYVCVIVCVQDLDHDSSFTQNLVRALLCFSEFSCVS